MDPESKDFAELSKKYKVTGLSKTKPKLRYYPNAVLDNFKMTRSYEIFFNKDSKDFSNVQEEVEQNYEHTVADVMGETFNQFVVKHAKEEQKNVIYYMYRSDQ